MRVIWLALLLVTVPLVAHEANGSVWRDAPPRARPFGVITMLVEPVGQLVTPPVPIDLGFSGPSSAKKGHG
jgi:hypothetical protein